MSAIRLALAPEAVPGLKTAGCLLVASFLEAGLDGGDPVVVRRLMALLLRPLQDWDKTQVGGPSAQRQPPSALSTLPRAG